MPSSGPCSEPASIWRVNTWRARASPRTPASRRPAEPSWIHCADSAVVNGDDIRANDRSAAMNRSRTCTSGSTTNAVRSPGDRHFDSVEM
jgi:hypothetical protein